MIILLSIKNFFSNFYNALCSIATSILTILMYCMGYPAVKTMLIVVFILFISDFVTRFYAIRVQNGTLFKAFLNKRFSSKAFINGFITKIIGYFVILTIANFATITPELDIIGKVISPFLYGALFFYEIISNLENLRDANFLAVIPILNKLKKEQKKFGEDKKEEVIDILPEVNSENIESDICFSEENKDIK